MGSLAPMTAILTSSTSNTNPQEESHTMEKTKVAEQVAEAIEQQQAEQMQPQEDPTVTLRRAMANNFLQHCVNAAIAEHGEATDQATAQGAMNAVADIAVNIIGALDEGTENRLMLIADALGAVQVNGTPLPNILMQMWAVSLSRQGRLHQFVGSMLDAGHQDMMRSMMAAANPPAPAPVVEAEPAAEAEPVAEPVVEPVAEPV